MSVSRQRWQLLSQALQKKEVPSASVEQASVRRFCSFNLFAVTKNEKINPDGSWLKYACIDNEDINALIRHVSPKITPTELGGFNNTGNVCVWPSEEVMAYYCIKHSWQFKDKAICELGGGMTCLAGLMTAISSEANFVLLSDGNDVSVGNVQAIIDQNTERFGETQVISRVLRWGQVEPFQEYKGVFDYVFCADCIYFKETMHHLVTEMSAILKPEGTAIIFAPSRGGTLEMFYKLVKDKFSVKKFTQYDGVVKSKHLENKTKNDDYNEDLHYPIMLQLHKCVS